MRLSNSCSGAIIMKKEQLHKVQTWLGLQLYLAVRDGAVIRLGVLIEVYEQLFGEKPDLEALEKIHGESA